MFRFMMILLLACAFLIFLTTAQTISPSYAPPVGYQIGLSTQDYESAGQQSICQISLAASTLLNK